MSTIFVVDDRYYTNFFMALLRTFYIILFLTLTATFTVFAQPLSKQPLTISGKIVSADSLSAIEDVHIINKRNGKGWLSRQDGTFTILVSQGDTLLFTAVGFEDKEIAFSASLLDKQRTLTVTLQPEVYELDQITITPYPTLEQFKQEFLHLKLPPTANNLVIPGLDANSVYNSNNNGQPTITLGGPITALYNSFSRREKAHRRSKVLEQTLTNNNLAASKYNTKIVNKVTGLEGEELNAFMKFCALPNAFILSATEYELHASINECYIAFLQSKAPASTNNSSIK